MQLLAILVAIMLQFSQPDVRLSATWLRPNVARIAWLQPAGVHQTCLYRQPQLGSHVLINCWTDLLTGNTGLTLPGATQNDATRFPVAGDVYTLSMDGNMVASEPLRGRVLLPVIRG